MNNKGWESSLTILARLTEAKDLSDRKLGIFTNYPC